MVAGSSPAWSPEGEPIVISQKVVQDEIYSLKAINPQGPGQEDLTSNEWDANPDWSPDHQFVVFQRMDLGWKLYTLRHNMFDLTATTVPGTVAGDQQPARSPDGNKLAFSAPVVPG